MPLERIFEKGQSIGPYEVVRVIAAGGMSIVYEAVPLKGLRDELLGERVDRVAVKVARMALPGTRRERKRMVDRLDREFRTLMDLSTLAHPNVVRVYDAGWDEGTPWYTMELVRGQTLGDVLFQRPRLGQIDFVFAQLCSAVAFLHAHGICHRDLKPSNVMLRANGGSPVLIDFGICLPPAQRTLTGMRELLGTAGYWSPEYAKHWLDETQTKPYLAAPTDDVWALGVIFYEILTGMRPWRTPPERHELMLKEIQTVQPRHPCELYERVPKPLGDFALRLLEKDVRQRPANAKELIGLLEEAAEGTDVLSPIAPRREWPMEVIAVATGGQTESGPDDDEVSAELAAGSGFEAVPEEAFQEDLEDAPEEGLEEFQEGFPEEDPEGFPEKVLEAASGQGLDAAGEQVPGSQEKRNRARWSAMAKAVAAGLMMSSLSYVALKVAVPEVLSRGARGEAGKLKASVDAGVGWPYQKADWLPWGEPLVYPPASEKDVMCKLVLMPDRGAPPLSPLAEQRRPPCRPGDVLLKGACWRKAVPPENGSPISGYSAVFVEVPMGSRPRCLGEWSKSP